MIIPKNLTGIGKSIASGSSVGEAIIDHFQEKAPNLVGSSNHNQSAMASVDVFELQRQNNEAAAKLALQQQQASQASADRAMQFEADQAALNRQWQENMSNTAYQRAVEDMRKAGINPMLAFSQGGASTPSGSVASGSSASMSRADVDMDTIASVLREYMSNESAESIARQNNVTKVLTSFISGVSGMYGFRVLRKDG